MHSWKITPFARIPDPGSKLTGGTVRLAVFDNGGANIFQIGKGFYRYA
jgi:hypothetical protein